MYARFFDFPTRLHELEDFRSQMYRLFEDYDSRQRTPSRLSWPRVVSKDTGESYVVMADVPGLSEKDISVNLTANTLTLSGERQTEWPEGVSVHRRERPALKFSRSYTFEHNVDVGKVTANVKDGVLTVLLPKVPEAQPRSINVTAG